MNPSNLDSDNSTIASIAKRVIPIQAISPESGGHGEKERADEICKLLKEMGHENYNRYDIQDDTGCIRSSVVLKIGNLERTLWIVSHIDTVPVGSLDLWSRQPFQATVEGDRIYGRGTADNGEGILSSFLLLKHLNIERMKYNLGLVFVSDEETGSSYGISPLLDKGLFTPQDLVLVPDSGTPDGSLIEVAEKSTLWLRFIVNGKQGHGSMPGDAINASKIGMRFILMIEEKLSGRFNASDPTFGTPLSTFTITKHEKNVDNVNTIPGRDVFYLDCRILPIYDLDMVLDYIHEEMTSFSQANSVSINLEIVQKGQAPQPTRQESEIYQLLSRAITAIQGIETKAIGIGGGTCAAFFRRRGINAVVWGISIPEVYHKPDEYVLVSNIIKAAEIEEKMLYD